MPRGLEEMHEQREQPQLALISQLFPVQRLDGHSVSFRSDDDAVVGRDSMRACARRLIAKLSVCAPG
jgi:hypothetical protein